MREYYIMEGLVVGRGMVESISRDPTVVVRAYKAFDRCYHDLTGRVDERVKTDPRFRTLDFGASALYLLVRPLHAIKAAAESVRRGERDYNLAEVAASIAVFTGASRELSDELDGTLIELN